MTTPTRTQTREDALVEAAGKLASAAQARRWLEGQRAIFGPQYAARLVASEAHYQDALADLKAVVEAFDAHA